MPIFSLQFHYKILIIYLKEKINSLFCYYLKRNIFIQQFINTNPINNVKKILKFRISEFKTSAKKNNNIYYFRFYIRLLKFFSNLFYNFYAKYKKRIH